MRNITKKLLLALVATTMVACGDDDPQVNPINPVPPAAPPVGQTPPGGWNGTPTSTYRTIWDDYQDMYGSITLQQPANTVDMYGRVTQIPAGTYTWTNFYNYVWPIVYGCACVLPNAPQGNGVVIWATVDYGSFHGYLDTNLGFWNSHPVTMGGGTLVPAGYQTSLYSVLNAYVLANYYFYTNTMYYNYSGWIYPTSGYQYPLANQVNANMYYNNGSFGISGNIFINLD